MGGGSEICFEGYFPPLKRRRKWSASIAVYIHKDLWQYCGRV
jgi:hypothetical protein